MLNRKYTTVGIITEYNPFHNGHLYHIEMTKKITGCDNIILVMSGNYVQRGEPAIIDKWNRANFALLNNVDIVIELPTHFAIESAENFAKASVTLLDSLGLVDAIVFGSECGDIKELTDVATFLNNNDYKQELKKYMSEGFSYKTTLDKILKDKGFSDIYNPNNILGIEYIKAIKNINSTITPLTIERTENNYHLDTLNTTGICSATALRKNITNNNFHNIISFIPNTIKFEMLEVLENNVTDIDNLSSIFHYKLSTIDKKSLQNINQINEGIENRIYKSSENFYKISDIVNNCSTKRYTKSKLRRIILSIIFDLTKDDMKLYRDNNLVQYVKILGFNKNKQDIIKSINKNCKLPVIMNVNKCILPPLAHKMLQQEIKYTNIYNLCYNNTVTNKNDEYTKKIITIN